MISDTLGTDREPTTGTTLFGERRMVVSIDFARELERENVALREAGRLAMNTRPALSFTLFCLAFALGAGLVCLFA